MSEAVLDASALLAFLQDEVGANKVAELLEEGAICGAANWSEVAQKVRSHGRDWDMSRALLQSYEIAVEPVTEDDAEWAATRWRAGEGLSLADRLCLALAQRRGTEAWTSDAEWNDDRARKIR